MAEINKNLVKFLKILGENHEIMNEFLSKKNVDELYEFASKTQPGFTIEEFKAIMKVIFSRIKNNLESKNAGNSKTEENIDKNDKISSSKKPSELDENELKKVNGGGIFSFFGGGGVDPKSEIEGAFYMYNFGGQLATPIKEAILDLKKTFSMSEEDERMEELLQKKATEDKLILAEYQKALYEQEVQRARRFLGK